MYYRKPSLKERLLDMVDSGREWLGGLSAHVRRMRTQGMTQREKRQALALGCLLVVAVVVCVLLVPPVVHLISDPQTFQELLERNYVLACVALALVNTVHVFVAIIPGEPLEILAGLLFGTVGGTIVTLVGLTLGELLVFLLVKRFGRRFVHLFVSQEKLDSLTLFQDQRRRNVITFLMMFIPGTPKDIWSYVVGLTPMTVGTWMAISIPARIPSIAISVLVGSMAKDGHGGAAGLLFLLVIIISALGIGYYLLISKQARQAAAMEAEARRQWVRDGRRTNDADSSELAREGLSHATK